MVRAAMPAIPARSIPVAVDPNGRVVDLPPIPESAASTDLDRIKPAPNQPSPQALHASAPGPGRDPSQIVAGPVSRRPIEFSRTAQGSIAGPSMPAIPSRSVPVAVDPKGRVVDLPPLPEALASADLNRIPPEPGQPSGQVPHVVSEPIRDPQLARTRFEPLDQPEARRAAGTTPGSASGITEARLHDSRPVEEGEARCAVGPATAPRTTVPALVASLIQKLSAFDPDIDIDLDLDDKTRAQIERYIASKNGVASDASVPCTMPGCKDHVESASARTQSPMSLSVSVKDTDGKRFVDSTSRLETALKTPGKTETQYIPLGGKFALEIKATLVPAGPGLYKEGKKIETAPSNP